MSESRSKKHKVEFIESYWTGGEFGSDYQWNDNHGELIRCKDCKYVGFKWKEDGKLFCNAPSGIGASGGSFEPDFFCAGGVRKERSDG